VSREFQKWPQVIGALAVVAWLTLGVVSAQRGEGLLRPPRATLVAIHWPDLTELEKDVRDQIKSQQDVLAAAVKNLTATDADLSAAYGQMGQTYHAYSLKAPARECYVNANRLAPKDFRWIYLLAKLDQQDGDVVRAIRGFKTVRSLRPEFVAATVNLGNIYLELNQLEDAQSSFANALQIDKRSASSYYGLGQVALSKRNYAEAVNYFEKALDLAPGANRLHYSLAMAYRGLGDAEKAKSHLAQQGTVGVRVADPLIDGLQELVHGARVHLIRGRMALEAKRYAEAVAEFREAVAATPDNVAAHVNLGAALTQTGDLNGAMEQFEATLQIDPNNTTAHYNLAVLLAGENKHQQAIAHLQAVSSINPNDIGATAMLIRLLAELDRCSEAADWQRKLITIATEQRREDLVTKFKTDLQRYENVRPCRPLEH
jgi:tetratricopeptide (TPR) repeat protein